jgi:hypothetical protein
MIIWIAASLAAASFVVSLNSLLRRRDALLEDGSVSMRWLAEYGQYQDRDRSR